MISRSDWEPLPTPTLSPFARGYLSLCRFFTAAVWCVPALRVPLVHSLINHFSQKIKSVSKTTKRSPRRPHYTSAAAAGVPTDSSSLLAVLLLRIRCARPLLMNRPNLSTSIRPSPAGCLSSAFQQPMSISVLTSACVVVRVLARVRARGARIRRVSTFSIYSYLPVSISACRTRSSLRTITAKS